MKNNNSENKSSMEKINMMQPSVKKFLRPVSLVTLFCFVTTQLASGAPTVGLPAGRQGMGVSISGAEIPQLRDSLLKIPAELGQVTDSVIGDPSAPAFIHIQSAHGNFQAEKNIEKLLGYIEKNSSVKLMLLEGAAGKLQPELFRMFPKHPDFNRKVTDKLMEEGYLTGPERFLIENDQRPETSDQRLATRGSSVKSQVSSHKSGVEAFGVEDLSSYKKDRQAFIKVVKQEKTAEKFLGSLRSTIDRRFSQKMNKDLLNLVRQEEAFGSGTLSFEGWLKALGEGSRQHLKVDLSDAFYQDQYPFLIRYYRLQAIASKIDAEKARAEQADFLGELRKRGVSKEIVALFLQDGGGRMAEGASSLSPSSIHHPISVPQGGYSPLRQALESAFAKLPRDFSMKQWPNWTLYAQNIILTQELEAKGLQNETSRLKDQILNKLATTADEKAYLVAARRLYLLRRLFNLELTRTEYSELQALHITPAKLAAGLQTRDTRPQTKASTVRPSAKGQLQSPVSSLQSVFANAVSFYETAIVRENHMFQNALKKMGETQQQRAVIVAGGFHADGLKKLAASKNASYIQISPRITEVTKRDHEVYINSILGTRTSGLDKANDQIERRTTNHASGVLENQAQVSKNESRVPPVSRGRSGGSPESQMLKNESRVPSPESLVNDASASNMTAFLQTSEHLGAVIGDAGALKKTKNIYNLTDGMISVEMVGLQPALRAELRNAPIFSSFITPAAPQTVSLPAPAIAPVSASTEMRPISRVVARESGNIARAEVRWLRPILKLFAVLAYFGLFGVGLYFAYSWGGFWVSVVAFYSGVIIGAVASQFLFKAETDGEEHLEAEYWPEDDTSQFSGTFRRWRETSSGDKSENRSEIRLMSLFESVGPNLPGISIASLVFFSLTVLGAIHNLRRVKALRDRTGNYIRYEKDIRAMLERFDKIQNATDGQVLDFAAKAAPQGPALLAGLTAAMGSLDVSQLPFGNAHLGAALFYFGLCSFMFYQTIMFKTRRLMSDRKSAGNRPEDSSKGTDNRSETRLTPAQEKQFQKALKDLQHRWWDSWFNDNGVARKVAAAKALGEFKDTRALPPLMEVLRVGGIGPMDAVLAFFMIGGIEALTPISEVLLQDGGKLLFDWFLKSNPGTASQPNEPTVSSEDAFEEYRNSISGPIIQSATSAHDAIAGILTAMKHARIYTWVEVGETAGESVALPYTGGSTQDYEYHPGQSYSIDHVDVNLNGAIEEAQKITSKHVREQTLEPSKGTSLKAKRAPKARSESRLTLVQEKQFQKALKDLQPRWFDGRFNGNGVERRISAIKSLGELNDARASSVLIAAVDEKASEYSSSQWRVNRAAVEVLRKLDPVLDLVMTQPSNNELAKALISSSAAKRFFDFNEFKRVMDAFSEKFESGVVGGFVRDAFPVIIENSRSADEAKEHLAKFEFELTAFAAQLRKIGAYDAWGEFSSYGRLDQLVKWRVFGNIEYVVDFGLPFETTEDVWEDVWFEAVPYSPTEDGGRFENVKVTRPVTKPGWFKISEKGSPSNSQQKSARQNRSETRQRATRENQLQVVAGKRHSFMPMPLALATGSDWLASLSSQWQEFLGAHPVAVFLSLALAIPISIFVRKAIMSKREEIHILDRIMTEAPSIPRAVAIDLVAEAKAVLARGRDFGVGYQPGNGQKPTYETYEGPIRSNAVDGISFQPELGSDDPSVTHINPDYVAPRWYIVSWEGASAKVKGATNSRSETRLTPEQFNFLVTNFFVIASAYAAFFSASLLWKSIKLRLGKFNASDGEIDYARKYFLRHNKQFPSGPRFDVLFMVYRFHAEKNVMKAASGLLAAFVSYFGMMYGMSSMSMPAFLAGFAGSFAYGITLLWVASRIVSIESLDTDQYNRPGSRSETRLTPSQEKQFQKALRDLQPGWFDWLFVQSSAKRKSRAFNTAANLLGVSEPDLPLFDTFLQRLGAMNFGDVIWNEVPVNELLAQIRELTEAGRDFGVFFDVVYKPASFSPPNFYLDDTDYDYDVGTIFEAREAVSQVLEIVERGNAASRSESRLTPAQEKQLQKALKDLQPKWFDGRFNGNGVERRVSAAKILGELKDPRAVDGLSARLADFTSVVRRAAAEALVAIGDPAMSALIDAFLRDSLVRDLVFPSFKKSADHAIQLLDKRVGLVEKEIASLRATLDDTPKTIILENVKVGETQVYVPADRPADYMVSEGYDSGHYAWVPDYADVAAPNPEIKRIEGAIGYRFGLAEDLRLLKGAILSVDDVAKAAAFRSESRRGVSRGDRFFSIFNDVGPIMGSVIIWLISGFAVVPISIIFIFVYRDFPPFRTWWSGFSTDTQWAIPVVATFIAPLLYYSIRAVRARWLEMVVAAAQRRYVAMERRKDSSLDLFMTNHPKVSLDDAKLRLQDPSLDRLMSAHPDLQLHRAKQFLNEAPRRAQNHILDLIMSKATKPGALLSDIPLERALGLLGEARRMLDLMGDFEVVLHTAAIIGNHPELVGTGRFVSSDPYQEGLGHRVDQIEETDWVDVDDYSTPYWSIESPEATSLGTKGAQATRSELRVDLVQMAFFAFFAISVLLSGHELRQVKAFVKGEDWRYPKYREVLTQRLERSKGIVNPTGGQLLAAAVWAAPQAPAFFAALAGGFGALYLFLSWGEVALSVGLSSLLVYSMVKLAALTLVKNGKSGQGPQASNQSDDESRSETRLPIPMARRVQYGIVERLRGIAPAMKGALDRLVVSEIKSRLKKEGLKTAKIRGVFAGMNGAARSSYFQTIDPAKLDLFYSELTPGELRMIRNGLRTTVEVQLKSARVVFDEAMGVLQAHADLAPVVAIMKELYPEVLRYLIKGQDVSPVHHVAYVVKFMAEILVSERASSDISVDEVMAGMVAALLHDSGNGYTVLEKISVSKLNEMQEPEKSIKRAAAKAFRLEHVVRGLQIADLLIGGKPELAGVMPTIRDIIERHDNPTIAELDDTPSKALLIGNSRGDLLLKLHREADRLWMVTAAGVLWDLRGDPKADRLAKLKGNIQRHRDEKALYEKVDKPLMFPLSQFWEGLLYRSETGYAIFNRERGLSEKIFQTEQDLRSETRLGIHDKVALAVIAGMMAFSAWRVPLFAGLGSFFIPGTGIVSAIFLGVAILTAAGQTWTLVNFLNKSGDYEKDLENNWKPLLKRRYGIENASLEQAIRISAKQGPITAAISAALAFTNVAGFFAGTVGAGTVLITSLVSGFAVLFSLRVLNELLIRRNKSTSNRDDSAQGPASRSESRFEILSKEALEKFKAGASEDWIREREALVVSAIQGRRQQLDRMLTSTQGGSEADVRERFEAITSTMESMVRALDFLSNAGSSHLPAAFALWKFLSKELLGFSGKPYASEFTQLSLFQALEDSLHQLARVVPAAGEVSGVYWGSLRQWAADLDLQLAGPDIASLKELAKPQIAEIRRQLTEEPFNVVPAIVDHSNGPNLITVPKTPHDFRTQILLHTIERLRSNQAWSQPMYDAFAAATNFSKNATVEFSLEGDRDLEISDGVVRLHKRFEALFSDEHINTMRTDLDLNTHRDLFFLLMVKMVTIADLGTGRGQPNYDDELMGLGAQAAAYQAIEVNTSRNDSTRLERLDELLKLAYPGRPGEAHSGALIHLVNAIRNIRDAHIYSEKRTKAFHDLIVSNHALRLEWATQGRQEEILKLQEDLIAGKGELSSTIEGLAIRGSRRAILDVTVAVRTSLQAISENFRQFLPSRTTGDPMAPGLEGQLLTVPLKEGLRWAFHFFNDELTRIEIQSDDTGRWERGITKLKMARAFYSRENDGLKAGDIVAVSFTEKRKLLIVVRDGDVLEKIRQNRIRVGVSEEDALSGRIPETPFFYEFLTPAQAASRRDSLKSYFDFSSSAEKAADAHRSEGRSFAGYMTLTGIFGMVAIPVVYVGGQILTGLGKLSLWIYDVTVGEHWLRDFGIMFGLVVVGALISAFDERQSRSESRSSFLSQSDEVALHSEVRLTAQERTVIDAPLQEIVDHLSAREEYVPEQADEKSWKPVTLENLQLDPAQKNLAMILGTWDDRTASEAATVIKALQDRGYEITVLTSGKYGNKPGVYFDADGNRLPEAVHYRNILEARGVSVRFVEPESVDTGKNILFSKRMLDDASYKPDAILLMQNPLLQRRAGLSVVRQYFGTREAFDASGIRLISYTPYVPVVSAMSDEEVMQTLEYALREVASLKVYPDKGYTIPNPVPAGVLSAEDALLPVFQELSLRSETRLTDAREKTSQQSPVADWQRVGLAKKFALGAALSFAAVSTAFAGEGGAVSLIQQLSPLVWVCGVVACLVISLKMATSFYVRSLVKKLRSEDLTEFDRVQLIEGLNHKKLMPKVRIANAFIKMLEEKDERVGSELGVFKWRTRETMALLHIIQTFGDIRAIKAVEKVANDYLDHEVRQFARKTLETLTHRLANADILGIDPTSLKDLRKLQRSPFAEARRWAIDPLYQLRAIDDLVYSLSDPELEVRSWAVTALINANALEALGNNMNSPFPDVRKAAKKALEAAQARNSRSENRGLPLDMATAAVSQFDHLSASAANLPKYPVVVVLGNPFEQYPEYVAKALRELNPSKVLIVGNGVKPEDRLSKSNPGGMKPEWQRIKEALLAIEPKIEGKWNFEGKFLILPAFIGALVGGVTLSALAGIAVFALAAIVAYWPFRGLIQADPKDDSMNTGQNIQSILRILKREKLSPEDLVIVQAPQGLLVSKRILEKQWPTEGGKVRRPLFHTYAEPEYAAKAQEFLRTGNSSLAGDIMVFSKDEADPLQGLVKDLGVQTGRLRDWDGKFLTAQPEDRTAEVEAREASLAKYLADRSESRSEVRATKASEIFGKAKESAGAMRDATLKSGNDKASFVNRQKVLADFRGMLADAAAYDIAALQTAATALRSIHRAILDQGETRSSFELHFSTFADLVMERIQELEVSGNSHAKTLLPESRSKKASTQRSASKKNGNERTLELREDIRLLDAKIADKRSDIAYAEKLRKHSLLSAEGRKAYATILSEHQNDLDQMTSGLKALKSKLAEREKNALATADSKEPDSIQAVSDVLTMSADASSRSSAAQILGRLKVSTAVTKLIGALDDRDASVVAASSDALISIGAPSVEPLLKLLGKRREELAVTILGGIGDVQAIEPLLDLPSRDYIVKALAEFGAAVIPCLEKHENKLRNMQILSLIKGPESTAALAKMLVSGASPKVHSSIAEVLEKRGWKPTDQEQEMSFLVATEKWNELADRGSSAVPYLEGAMSQSAAVMALSTIYDARVPEILRRALYHSDSRIAGAAAEAFINVRDPESLRVLITNLSVRGKSENAARALLNMHDARLAFMKSFLEGKAYKSKYVRDLTAEDTAYILEGLAKGEAIKADYEGYSTREEDNPPDLIGSYSGWTETVLVRSGKLTIRGIKRSEVRLPRMGVSRNLLTATIAGFMAFFALAKEAYAGAYGVPTQPSKVATSGRLILVQQREQNGNLGNAYPLTIRGDKATLQINGKTVFYRGGGFEGARGINVLVLDAATGTRVLEYRSFDTWASLASHTALVDYLNSLPNGAIVLFSVSDEAGLVGNSTQALQTKALLSSSVWGSTEIDNINFRDSWVMVAIKGQGKLSEAHGLYSSTTGYAPATTTAQPTITLNPNAGLRAPYIPILPIDQKYVSARRVGANAEFQFKSVSGLVYQVEYSNDLKTWNVLRGGIVADGATTLVVDNGAFSGGAPSTVAKRFYRAKVTGQVSRSESRQNKASDRRIPAMAGALGRKQQVASLPSEKFRSEARTVQVAADQLSELLKTQMQASEEDWAASKQAVFDAITGFITLTNRQLELAGADEAESRMIRVQALRGIQAMVSFPQVALLASESQRQQITDFWVSIGEEMEKGRIARILEAVNAAGVGTDLKKRMSNAQLVSDDQGTMRIKDLGAEAYDPYSNEIWTPYLTPDFLKNLLVNMEEIVVGADGEIILPLTVGGFASLKAVEKIVLPAGTSDDPVARINAIVEYEAAARKNSEKAATETAAKLGWRDGKVQSLRDFNAFMDDLIFSPFSATRYLKWRENWAAKRAAVLADRAWLEKRMTELGLNGQLSLESFAARLVSLNIPLDVIEKVTSGKMTSDTRYLKPQGEALVDRGFVQGVRMAGGSASRFKPDLDALIKLKIVDSAQVPDGLPRALAAYWIGGLKSGGVTGVDLSIDAAKLQQEQNGHAMLAFVLSPFTWEAFAQKTWTEIRGLKNRPEIFVIAQNSSVAQVVENGALTSATVREKVLGHGNVSGWPLSVVEMLKRGVTYHVTVSADNPLTQITTRQIRGAVEKMREEGAVHVAFSNWRNIGQAGGGFVNQNTVANVIDTGMSKEKNSRGFAPNTEINLFGTFTNILNNAALLYSLTDTGDGMISWQEVQKISRMKTAEDAAALKALQERLEQITPEQTEKIRRRFIALLTSEYVTKSDKGKDLVQWEQISGMLHGAMPEAIRARQALEGIPSSSPLAFAYVDESVAEFRMLHGDAAVAPGAVDYLPMFFEVKSAGDLIAQLDAAKATISLAVDKGMFSGEVAAKIRSEKRSELHAGALVATENWLPERFERPGKGPAISGIGLKIRVTTAVSADMAPIFAVEVMGLAAWAEVLKPEFFPDHYEASTEFMRGVDVPAALKVLKKITVTGNGDAIVVTPDVVKMGLLPVLRVIYQSSDIFVVGADAALQQKVGKMEQTMSALALKTDVEFVTDAATLQAALAKKSVKRGVPAMNVSGLYTHNDSILADVLKDQVSDAFILVTAGVLNQYRRYMNDVIKDLMAEFQATVSRDRSA